MYPVIRFPAAILVLALVTACGGAAPIASSPTASAGTSAAVTVPDPALAELRIDYATYSPPSLVLKKKGWVEEAFTGTTIKWVYSAGSSNALNFLQANAVDFGSTAGSAALLTRANGNPIKVVYIYEQPEWTALVVAASSTAKDIRDLRGKKIAAQKGTDPYFFLLRTLNAAGLSQADIQYVNLPHADGRTALERGQIDAWSGLDPHMAASELAAGSKLIYRNKDYNTYGFLNSREDFLRKYPETTKKLIQLYERAKSWIVDNPDQAAQILADDAQIGLEVAKRELFDRMNFKTPSIPGTDLVDGSYARAVVK
jgi:sulfonate transport system substrate-binding protein